jgi:hypothetical protein
MASSGEKGFSLHVGIYIAKKDEEAWWALFKPVFDLVTAMPECVFFELYKADVDGEPDVVNISWVENWTESFGWFQEVSGHSGNKFYDQVQRTNSPKRNNCQKTP